MLDPQDFDGMVARIRAEDPKFVRRIDRLSAPRRRFRMTMAILLWTIAPFCIYFGGWTGLIMAVVAVGYGANLTKRSGLTSDPAHHLRESYRDRSRNRRRRS